jgi:hypothetical protein
MQAKNPSDQPPPPRPPKPPRGCFWRQNTLWGRARVGGRVVRWSLHTDDAAVAEVRRRAYRNQLAAQAYYEQQRWQSPAFVAVDNPILPEGESSSLAAVLERINRRRAALPSPRNPARPLSERAASVLAGLSPDYLRSLRRQHEKDIQKGITTNAGIKLARALRTTPSWLLHGRGPEIVEPEAVGGSERLELRVEWSIGAETDKYYVSEKLDDAELNRWGPLPSKGLAYRVMQERKKLIEDRIKISIGVIPHPRDTDEKT